MVFIRGLLRHVSGLDGKEGGPEGSKPLTPSCNATNLEYRKATLQHSSQKIRMQEFFPILAQA